MELVTNNNVICAKADFTKKNEFGEAYLKWSGNKGAAIPYLAIIPAGRADEPIILDAIVTKQQVLDALEEAGASKID